MEEILYVPVYRKDGTKKWVRRKESIPLPWNKAIVWYREWLAEQRLGLAEERKLVRWNGKR